MQSRMERYQTSNKKRYERTKKNTKLYEKVYDDIYSDTTYKNMSIIDSAKEININKLKNILDDKYDTRQYRTLKNFSNEDFEFDDKIQINISDNQSYDINKIIDDAKSKRAFIEETREKQKYYDFMEDKDVFNQDEYSELEKEEKELEELINTMAISVKSDVAKIDDAIEEDDLLSELKGESNTIVTNPIKTNFEDSNVNELTNTSVSSKTSNKVDKTFYTDSNMFTKNDFEDFSTISKELNRKRSPFKIILIILLLIIVVVSGYFVVTEFFIK